MEKASVKLLAVLVFWGAISVWGQTRPLIMEHADSLSVNRSRGVMVLKGNVRFKHDSVAFKTGLAYWNRNRDVVSCENSFFFAHPQGTISARSGRYERKGQKAEAFGKVESRDSTGDAAFFGERLLFDRETNFLDLPSQPKVHRYFKDSLGNVTDTLQIIAKRITYNSDTEVAQATGNVVITKGNLRIDCQEGLFDRAKNTLNLVGQPICNVDEARIKGDSMFVQLENENLKSVRVVRNATGEQKEEFASAPTRFTYVEGDTLFVNFQGDQIEELYVSIGAKSKFWENDLTEYVNTIDGDKLELKFLQGELNFAQALGTAASSYWYIDDHRKVVGKNDALGDSIFIKFDSTKVANLRIIGNKATGKYTDLSKQVKIE